MTDFQRALYDPKSAFEYPKDVLADDTLTKEQKLKVLQQWEYDARELQVAEEENMLGDSSPTMLNRIVRALRKLDNAHDDSEASDTKHG